MLVRVDRITADFLERIGITMVRVDADWNVIDGRCYCWSKCWEKTEIAVASLISSFSNMQLGFCKASKMALRPIPVMLRKIKVANFSVLFPARPVAKSAAFSSSIMHWELLV